MDIAAHRTSTGYLLPSVHSTPPFFSQQRKLETHAKTLETWTRLILGYARHRRLFTLSVEECEKADGEWREVLRNESINRRLVPSYLSTIITSMVQRNLAAYEPQKQTRSVLLYWRLPEEWAEALHEWASNTGQLSTILTFYEITDPPVESPMSGIPVPLLRKAIAVLTKTDRAQIISIEDGEGVRLLPGSGR